MAKYKITFELDDLPKYPEFAKGQILDSIHEGIIGLRIDEIHIELIELDESEQKQAE